MPDISRFIASDNITYDLKDSIAREHIQDHNNPHQVTAEQAGAVPKSELDGETSTVTGDIVTFETESAQVLPSVIVDIDPVQNLHGYDHPWPAGGGKNLIPLTVEGIKAENTSGTWNGNSYTAITGVKFTITVDDANNVIGVVANGTSSGISGIVLARNVAIPAGDYYLNGCPSGGGESKYRLTINDGNIASDYGNELHYTPSESKTALFSIYVFNGQKVSNLIFKPMLRLSSVTDPSFTPYSNICPISGWDGCTVERTGKNLFLGWETVTTNSATSYRIHVDFTSNTYYTVSGLNVNKPSWIFAYDDNDVFVGRTYGQYINTLTVAKTSFMNGEGTKDYDSISYIILQYYTWTDITRDAVEALPTQIESGSTATAFEPCKNYTYSISFPSSAGTVYGGTLDVTNGVLTVTHGSKQVPEEKSHISSVSSSGETVTFWIYARGLVEGTSDDTPICDTLKYNPIGSISLLSLNEFCWSKIYISSFFCRMSTTLVGTTEDSIWAYLQANPLTVYSQMSAPVTYQLTPTQVTALLGQNNLWADTGDSTVIYRTGKVALLSDIANSEETAQASLERLSDDLNDKIDSLTASDVGAANDNSIATVEPTSTASTSHAVGDYLMLGGVLYEVTSAIAAGETITQGTNVTPVTVMESMAELAGAIPQRYNASTNPTGYLTISDLPVYDGTVI